LNRTARNWVLASALWTFFVWTTRVRNITSDDDLSAGEKFGALLVSLAFIVSAVVLLALLVRQLTEALQLFVPVFAIGTVGWWAVRTVLILVRDHGWGFRIVHTVLAIVSAVLALAAWRAVRVERVRS
jgi:hypothetical protein